MVEFFYHLVDSIRRSKSI